MQEIVSSSKINSLIGEKFVGENGRNFRKLKEFFHEEISPRRIFFPIHLLYVRTVVNGVCLC